MYSIIYDCVFCDIWKQISSTHDSVKSSSTQHHRLGTLSMTLTDDDSTGSFLMVILSIWFLCPSQIAWVLVEVRRSQASCVYLRGMSIHTATGEASRVYSIIINQFEVRLHYRYTGRAAACDACADMGMTYSVILQCTDCVVFPNLKRLMLYTRLASPVAVCIAKRGRNTRLDWLANPNPNPTNPNPNPNADLNPS